MFIHTHTDMYADSYLRICESLSYNNRKIFIMKNNAKHFVFCFVMRRARVRGGERIFFAQHNYVYTRPEYDTANFDYIFSDFLADVTSEMYADEKKNLVYNRKIRYFHIIFVDLFSSRSSAEKTRDGTRRAALSGGEEKSFIPHQNCLQTSVYT